MGNENEKEVDLALTKTVKVIKWVLLALFVVVGFYWGSKNPIEGGNQ